MPFVGRQLSIEEALALGAFCGLEDPKPLRWFVAVMTAESRRFTEAYGFNVRVEEDGTFKVSIDRGLMQVNDRAHPSFGMAASFNPVANVRYAVELSQHATNFEHWNGFKSGAYKDHLDDIYRVWKRHEWEDLIEIIADELS